MWVIYDKLSVFLPREIDIPSFSIKKANRGGTERNAQYACGSMCTYLLVLFPSEEAFRLHGCRSTRVLTRCVLHNIHMMLLWKSSGATPRTSIWWTTRPAALKRYLLPTYLSARHNIIGGSLRLAR